MDPVNPKALKGKFKDREDKDIDNDGDVDSSDEYLHKRRSAVSKAIGKVKEAVELDEDIKGFAKEMIAKASNSDKWHDLMRSKYGKAKWDSYWKSNKNKDFWDRILDTGFNEEVELDEAKLSTQQRDRLDNLILNVHLTTHPEYDGEETPGKYLKDIEKEFGASVAKQVKDGMEITHWGRDNRSSGNDKLSWRKGGARITKSGKMNKQDVEALKNRIKRDKAWGGITKKVKLPEESVVAKVLDRMSEAKDSYTINHKTFSSAVQHAEEVVNKRGFEVDPEEWDRKVSMGPRKPGAGKTNSYTIALMKNGKEVKQKLQMQVYYDEGRYELNMYIS